MADDDPNIREWDVIDEGNILLGRVRASRYNRGITVQAIVSTLTPAQVVIVQTFMTEASAWANSND